MEFRRMVSPFPGMDPYLEHPGFWPGFHGQALTAIVAQLVPQVTPAYVVQMEEQLFIHELPAEERRYLGRADIAVGTGPWPGPSSQTTSGVLAASVEVRLPAVDVERQRYIEIRDRRNRSLVTVIELLSPSNKRSGPDREQYLTKRVEILASPTHLVEIDLLAALSSPSPHGESKARLRIQRIDQPKQKTAPSRLLVDHAARPLARCSRASAYRPTGCDSRASGHPG